MKEQSFLEQLKIRLERVSVFRPLIQKDLVLSEFLAFLQASNVPENQQEMVKRYCEYVSRLYAEGGDLGAYVLEQVLNYETPLLKKQIQGEIVPSEMQECLEIELETFTLLSELNPSEIINLFENEEYLPQWKNTQADFVKAYKHRLQQAATKGYGIFAKYHMFKVGEQKELVPVRTPDKQKLSDLTGYAVEREKILVNTQALLKGLSANNILLYGDAGTGKSSTVKAIANELYPQGLRLIEVAKNQLYGISTLLDSLAENPLKFILFIDDLSFSAGDDDFLALKAILEGNISARPKNVVVYATSNRRHLIQQNFSDRQAEVVNLSDTLQEEASLSDRFGLVITFLSPDKDLYLEIVENLAKEYEIVLPKQMLFAKAEAHALRYGGRSPRTAKQFVEYCKAEQSIK